MGKYGPFDRWFIWSIVAVVSAAAILLIYIQSYSWELAGQTIYTPAVVSLPTSQLYSSSKLGLSVRYPVSWQVEVDPIEPNVITLENPKDFNENISISLIKPEFEKVLRDSLSMKHFTETEILVGGVPASMLKNSQLQDKAIQNVIFVKVAPDREYYIAGSALEFEKIIASIKLLP